MRRRLPMTAFAALLALAGCSDDGGSDDADTSASDGTSTGDADAGPIGRTYLLGGRAEGYDPTVSRPWVADFDVLPADLTEVVVVPLEQIGIPWDSFTGFENRPTDLPGPWLTRFNALKASAEATGKPLAVAISPLSRAVDGLAPSAREEGGQLILNDSFRPPCYNPASDGNPTRWRDAYAGFAVWVVQQLEPRWIIVGQRMNLYEANCGRAPYDAVVDFAGEAHRRLKALDDGTPIPTTIVGVDVEDLYGFPKKSGRCVVTTAAECFETRKGLLDGLEADVLGLDSYPAFAVDGVEEIDAAWLTRPVDHRDDLGAAIIGTSYPAQDLNEKKTVGCAPIIASSEADQRLYVDMVVDAGETRDMQLVIWRSLSDLLDADVIGTCPCAGDTAICQHLDQLNAKEPEIKLLTASGLVTTDGTERSAADVWRQAMQ